MFGSVGNFANLMKQASTLSRQMKERQEELAKMTFDGDAGGGLVKATLNGQMELVRLTIEPQAAQDVELLEDLIKAAVNAGQKKARDAVQRTMADFTSGLNIPGLGELLSGPGQNG